LRAFHDDRFPRRTGILPKELAVRWSYQRSRSIGNDRNQLETLTGESEADTVRDHYLDAYDQIQREKLPSVISVKPTQLGLDHSIDSCRQHLDTLARKAVATNSQLWIDMEDSSYVDRTLSLYRELKSKYAPIGIAIQAYLRRTPQDIDGLLDINR
jgi:proline dehydrogenase